MIGGKTNHDGTDESLQEGPYKTYSTGKLEGYIEGAENTRAAYNHSRKFLFWGGFVSGLFAASFVWSFFV